jgi:hypothetical protein
MGTRCQYKIYGDRLLIQKYIYGISLITMHGMRVGVHITLGISPSNLVFNKDMFLNIPLFADCHAITQRRENHIHENLMKGKPEKRAMIMIPSKWNVRKNRSLKSWAKEHVVRTK